MLPRCLISALVLLLSLPSALAQEGPVISFGARVVLTSRILEEDRVILVSLPQGYTQSQARYPVLYMTDGPAHFLHTVATAEFLARNGRMPPVIVVGIANTDRTRDLTPTRGSLARGDDGRVEFPTSGGADRFLAFIEDELVPFVESRFRTEPFRVLAGHSFGGLFAIHAFLERPDLLQAVIAVSPTFDWDEALLLRRATPFFGARKAMNRTLVFTLGDEPRQVEGFRRFEALLRGSRIEGFRWASHWYEDDDHGSLVQRSHDFGLRAIWSGWQIPRDRSTGAILGDLPEVEAHFGRLSKRFGYAIPVPEGVLNLLGYQHLQAGRVERAIEIFQRNVREHPDSANVHDSLAEAYEQTGELALAREGYERAVRLGEARGDPNLEIFRRNFDRVSLQLQLDSSPR